MAKSGWNSANGFTKVVEHKVQRNGKLDRWFEVTVAKGRRIVFSDSYKANPIGRADVAAKVAEFGGKFEKAVLHVNPLFVMPN